MAEKTYNARYYEAHRENILKRRRLKYLTDKEYRERAKLRSKVQTALISAQKKTMQRTVLHNGRVEQQMPLSALLHAANRSKDVIYSMRRSKLMPQPSHKNNRGDGVYSESQIKLVGFLFTLSDSGEAVITYRMISKVLFKLWKKSFSKEAVMRELKGVLSGKGEKGSAKSFRPRISVSREGQESRI
jgi:hypothetical protein